MTRPSFTYHTKPYEHQDIVFQRTKDEVAWGLLLEMGCGKSKIFIDTAAHLYCEGKINGVFLIAPKGVYGIWSDSSSGQVVTHLHPDVLARSKMLKWRSNHVTKKFQEELQDLLNTPEDDLAIFVMNGEALTSKAAVGAAVAFLKSRKVLMGVDEATMIKTPTAQITGKVVKLGRGAKYRRILTGTPVTNSPLDVFSLYEFLDPNILGYSSFFAFRARYALLARQQVGARAITVVRGYQRQDELREKMERGGVIMKKTDCLDLPDKVYETRNVELSSNQKRLYESMRLRAIAELSETSQVNAPLALTKLLRLHQITLGFLTEDEFDEEGETIISKKTYEIDPDGGPRARELLNVLDEIGPDQKVIIWCNYRYNVETLYRLIRSTYGGTQDVVGCYYGETSQEDRELLVRKFNDKKDPLRFFIGNSKVGGFGLTLTSSANTVYFSSNFSLETRLQSEDRNHRIGQTRSVTYTDLRCPGTIDDKIIKALRDKRDIAESLTSGGWMRFLESGNDDELDS